MKSRYSSPSLTSRTFAGMSCCIARIRSRIGIVERKTSPVKLSRFPVALMASMDVVDFPSHANLAATLPDQVCHMLPQLSWSKLRVQESLDQRGLCPFLRD